MPAIMATMRALKRHLTLAQARAQQRSPLAEAVKAAASQQH